MFAVTRMSLLKSTDSKLFLRESAKNNRKQTSQVAKNLFTNCSSQLYKINAMRFVNLLAVFLFGSFVDIRCGGGAICI